MFLGASAPLIEYIGETVSYSPHSQLIAAMVLTSDNQESNFLYSFFVSSFQTLNFLDCSASADLCGHILRARRSQIRASGTTPSTPSTLQPFNFSTLQHFLKLFFRQFQDIILSYHRTNPEGVFIFFIRKTILRMYLCSP